MYKEMQNMLNSTYWTERYDSGQTGWDIGYPSTPLKTYIDQLDRKSIKILMPGAGLGYEVQYLAEQGFSNVTVVDISPKPFNHINYKLPKEKGFNLVVEDFFSHVGEYDIILEQTFFCAIDPDLRPNYIRKTHELLIPGGKLVGVLFNRLFEHDGPPFGGTMATYIPSFEQVFSKVSITPCYNSIPPRQASEVFIKATK